MGLSPAALLSFLLMFSSPINSGTVEKPSNKIFKVDLVFTSLQQDLVFFLERFFLSQNFTFLIFSLNLSSTSLQAIFTTQSQRVSPHLGYRIMLVSHL